MKQKYFYDIDFFNKDNEQSFYWAGFIAADGNISKKNDFTLSLKQSDLEHIENFKTHIASNAPIKILPPKEKIINGINTKTSGTALIRFRANYWEKSLYRFGIIPNKTKTYHIPNEIINNQYFKHFIRGYFDGDGWFSIKYKNKKQKLCFGLCGNLTVLQNIQNHLQKQCEIESTPSIYKQKTIFKFEFQSQHDVNKITNYLYNNHTVSLKRKYANSLLSNQCNQATNILNLDKDKLRESYLRLKSYKLVAAEFKCSKSSICNYIKKYNII